MAEKRVRAPIDMVNGKVLPQLLRFAVPMMLTGVLQLLYNAADLIVVGKFTGDAAAASLAAVGATGSLVTLILNIFIGLSTGANVVIARAIGAGDDRQAGTATHTAITVSVICGLAVGVVSAVCAHLFVQWMDTPSDALDGATLYFRIVALGFPASLVYNFGAAVLRSVGDTKRPLYFLIVSGMVNVVLNLILVIVFRLGVAGVAIATCVAISLRLFGDHGAARHAQPLPPASARSRYQQKRSCADHHDRRSRQHPKRLLQHRECHDPVVHQLIRHDRGRGQHRRHQP